MPRLRLFGPAREVAGTGLVELAGSDVAAVLAAASDRYGSGFDAVVGASRIWLNGVEVDPDHPVAADDELAVLPPVSGG